MKKAELLTAIITPFDEQNKVNFPAMDRLIDVLIEQGSDGFVVGGTTGESATMTHDEQLEVYRHTAEYINGRVPLIVGTGSNNTQASVDFTKEVSQIDGIDAALVVTPYYNKPNQKGMLAHFSKIANEGGLPVMLYNIPGRSIVKLDNESVIELAKNPNIIGVKQVTSVEDIKFIVENTADDFLVYSGEDAQALAAKKVGANGVISVASHVVAKEMHDMYAAFDAGNVADADAMNAVLVDKMKAVFMLPSPAPVKAALNHMGMRVGTPRLPILPLDEQEEKQLFKILGI